MTQWYDRLSTAFAPTEVGLIGGKFYEPRDLTVTTYDSAYMHMDRLGNRWGLLVFDECHHLPGPSYVYAAEFSLAPYRLGLTATPDRADGRHTLLDDLIGPTLYQRQIRELSGEYLAAYTVRRLTVTLTDQERTAYEEARTHCAMCSCNLPVSGSAPSRVGELSCAPLRRPRLAGKPCSPIKQCVVWPSAPRPSYVRSMDCCANMPVIVCSSSPMILPPHNPSRAAFLLPSVTHQTDARERRAMLEGFRAGTFRALVAAQVLNEGVDLPEANVGIVLAGTASVREHVQRLGRLLRRVGDKQAILYEVIARDTLEEGAARRRRQHDAYRTDSVE